MIGSQLSEEGRLGGREGSGGEKGRKGVSAWLAKLGYGYKRAAPFSFVWGPNGIIEFSSTAPDSCPCNWAQVLCRVWDLNFNRRRSERVGRLKEIFLLLRSQRGTAPMVRLSSLSQAPLRPRGPGAPVLSPLDGYQYSQSRCLL